MPRAEFDRLVAPLQRRMVNCVWRIVRSGPETEDVMQEVLLQIWDRFDEVRRHPNPTALLLRFCTHRALDHLRRGRARQTALEGPDVSATTPALTPLEHLTQDERRDQLLAFIGQLPPREAEAIALHALEEMDPNEIAIVMACRPSTVRVLLSRARERFRTAFARSVSITR